MTGWNTISFNKAFKDVTSKGNKIPQDSFQTFGKYPIIDQGESFIAGYLDDESLAWKENLPVVIFGDHTRILKFIDFPFILGADGTKVLQPSKELFPKFAYYNLLFLNIPSAGYSRHFRFLKESEIPLPSLDEQKRIAAILDKADRLRRQRRFAQKLSDSFLQSVFVKMFGDIVSNSMNWEVSSLRKISAKFSDGPFGSNLKTEHYTDSGIPVIRLQNIGIGEYVESHPSFISDSHFKILSKHSCIPGDIIVGTMGEPNLRACILPKSVPNAVNKADCVQIRVDKNKSNSDYICGLLNMPQTLFLASGMILGQTRSRISMGRLAELEIPVPPLPLQEKFAEIVQKFERIRRQQREATRHAEHLFQTLLHRAFRGEL